MDTKVYNPAEALGNNKQNLVDGIELAKGENAARILPAETTFAVVVQSIQRAEGESFTELSVNMIPTNPMATIGKDNSLVGRFTGYFAVVGTNFTVYKSDGTVAAQGPVSSVTSELDLGAYVLHVGGQKFRVEGSALQINGQHAYRSNAFGTRGGLTPLFKELVAGGAPIELASNRKQTVWYVILLVVVVAATVAVIIAGKK